MRQYRCANLSLHQLANAHAQWANSLDTKDIADLLGVQEAAVYNGLANFRERLRKQKEVAA